MKPAMEKLEHFLELGGTKKDITLLVISSVALIVSIFDLVPLPFDASWAAIILCGIPIILEAVIGLVTAFDIKGRRARLARADRVGLHRRRLRRG